MKTYRKIVLIALCFCTLVTSTPFVSADPPSITSMITGKTVTIDGTINLSNEYAFANSHTFASRDGLVKFYVHHDGSYLYIGMDVDGTISYGEQILLMFDLDHDHIFKSTDLMILWHGDSHGDPAGGSGPWIGTGIGLGNEPLPDVIHAHAMRSGGYTVEFAIPMYNFQQSPLGFHIRHSPDSNQNYIWEAPGDVQGIYDDYDASYYGHLLFGGMFVIPENPFGTIGTITVMIVSMVFFIKRTGAYNSSARVN